MFLSATQHLDEYAPKRLWPRCWIAIVPPTIYLRIASTRPNQHSRLVSVRRPTNSPFAHFPSVPVLSCPPPLLAHLALISNSAIPTRRSGKKQTSRTSLFSRLVSEACADSWSHQTRPERACSTQGRSNEAERAGLGPGSPTAPSLGKLRSECVRACMRRETQRAEGEQRERERDRELPFACRASHAFNSRRQR